MNFLTAVLVADFAPPLAVLAPSGLALGAFFAPLGHLFGRFGAS